MTLGKIIPKHIFKKMDLNYNFLINSIKTLDTCLKSNIIGFAGTFTTHFHPKLFKVG